MYCMCDQCSKPLKQPSELIFELTIRFIIFKACIILKSCWIPTLSWCVHCCVHYSSRFYASIAKFGDRRFCYFKWLPPCGSRKQITCSWELPYSGFCISTHIYIIFMSWCFHILHAVKSNLNHSFIIIFMNYLDTLPHTLEVTNGAQRITCLWAGNMSSEGSFVPLRVLQKRTATGFD